MQLRTKLVLTASGLTFAIVLVLSIIFLGELLRQRIEQTYSNDDVLARQVMLATRQALLHAPPPQPLSGDQSPEDALHAAVVDALRSNDPLLNTMDAIIRYSPTVQDVSVTDAHGFTIVSTDPDAVNQRAVYRPSFNQVREENVFDQIRQVFGTPRVLDISEPLDRNHMPFLVIHLGVRSTFLRNAYEPWLRAALGYALIAILASVVVAAFLSALALRPLRTIGEQLEQLALPRGKPSGRVLFDQPPLMIEAPAEPKNADPIGRVNRSIDLLGRELQNREEGYTALRTNLDQMLDTLRDGVLLFAPDRRAVMVSDAVAHFLGSSGEGTYSAVDELVGRRLDEIFPRDTVLGAAVSAAFDRGAQISAETVTLEDGRQVQISVDRIADSRRTGDRRNGDNRGANDMGTLLTLRDTGTALEIEQELEVSRRLAAIGRLTANVGHEVKNPINAMVVHLELLRSKLASGAMEGGSAQKHVDILADEMRRLDRVVQALADFSRPMELQLREQDLRKVVQQTVELAGLELNENGVTVEQNFSASPLLVRVDSELLHQALLNLLLNAMQAMPSGGTMRVNMHRDQRMAVIEISDTGTGIPAAVLPKIFDLYFTTKSKGSGIGLAMTYRIVQLHGGAMDVRSDAEPGSPTRGTTFKIQIPMSAVPATNGRLQQPGKTADVPNTSNVDIACDSSALNATNIGRKEIA